MAAWPELDELKQVLDVKSDDWDGDDDDTRLTALLSSAIAKVKADVGDWDEDDDEPDDSLGRAALRMAELMALKPEVTAALGFRDATYERFLFGHRRTFGIA